MTLISLLEITPQIDNNYSNDNNNIESLEKN